MKSFFSNIDPSRTLETERVTSENTCIKAGRTGSYPGVSNAVAANNQAAILFVQDMLIIHDY
jgi:hypothetical protein